MYKKRVQGRQGSNPQPTRLECAVLPIELRPFTKNKIISSTGLGKYDRVLEPYDQFEAKQRFAHSCGYGLFHHYGTKSNSEWVWCTRTSGEILLSYIIDFTKKNKNESVKKITPLLFITVTRVRLAWYETIF